MVDKINRSSLSIQKDIEIISQVGGFNNKYKPFDIEKAKKSHDYWCRRWQLSNNLQYNVGVRWKI